jgi:iron complex outermembrane receptor protein
MKNNGTRRIASTQSIALGAAWVAALIATPTFAQQSIERVEITGSSIKRVDAETALPVQIVTRQEIEATGAANVEQFLQGLGVALQGNNNSVAATASGATSGGVSSVSLRGLGSQRTLVLIDGKRVSAGGTLTDSTSVDVNHIPVAAIERVEVLKDGASAIYGSDAIGGVINFILRKDYKGGEITPYVNRTQHPGGRGWGASGLLGWGNMAADSFNATMSFDYKKQDALYGKDRDFAKSGINVGNSNDTSSGNTFPANFAAADGSFGTRNPNFATGCNGGPYQTFSPLFAGIGSRGCRFDPSPLVSLLPETEQTSIFGTVRYAFASDVEGYGQFSYSNKEQRTIIQPVPISDQFALPLNHPLFNVAPYSTFGGVDTFLLQGPGRPNASIYYPLAQVQAITGGATPDLKIRYRSVLTGNRDISDISDQTRVVLGVKAPLASGWDSDTAFLHVDTKLAERVNNGYPSLSGILPLLNSGQVNPFGANTPTVQAQADATQFRGDAWKTKTSIDSLATIVRHDLTPLSGGPLALAVGTDARREGFTLDPSPAIQSGDISGYGGNFLPIDKSRLVGASYAELVAPVVRSVELTAAVRYDHYENVGSKTSPKFGARWQPAREVVLRGSVGRGFRAPALTELFQPNVIGVTAPGLNDPLRCKTSQSSKDCVTQFPITLGGNPNLQPETSTNRTLGIVFEPTNNTSFAFDWWEVDLKQTIISGIAPAVILSDLAKYGSFITRGPVGSGDACAGCPGPITNIDQTNTNLGETRVRGVDVDFRHRMPTGDSGVYTVGLNGTYFLNYEIQNPDGSFSSINGQVSPITQGVGGVIPRWRHYLYLDWKLAPWSLTLAQQYQSRYQDIPGTFEDPTDPAFHSRNVLAYSIFHFYSSYTGLIDKNLKVTFGIRNLLDTKPPYTNAGGQNYFQAGYDPGYVDPRGRTFLLSATYKFM